MTLINKTTRAFLVACLFATLFGAGLCFLLLRKIIKDEATEQLVREKGKIERYIRENEAFPDSYFVLSDRISMEPTDLRTKQTFSDTTFYHKRAHEFLEFKKTTFVVEIKHKLFKIIILKALFEADELLKALLIAFGGLIILLIGLLFGVNYFLSRSIWKPFYETLGTLKTFRIAQNEPVVFNKTDITEFRTLQSSLQNLTNHAQREYQSLKNFTENASHELQTPLAVIGSNLELLIQDSNLTSNQLQQISSLIESIGKLSKLNQTLLLITKIENRQFIEVENVDFSEAVKEKINLLEVWIEHKKLKVKTNIEANIMLEINHYLADVLLNNLLSNAIKYNILEGELSVELNIRELIIKNTGLPLRVLPDKLFERFQKDNSYSDSLGLGLALVKQICETYNFDIQYIYENGWHIVTITF